MAIGHLASTHRVWLSVAAYLIMGWIISYVLVKIGITLAGNTDFFSVEVETAAESLNNCMKAGGIVIIALLVENAILWVITHLILKKKLNIL